MKRILKLILAISVCLSLTACEDVFLSVEKLMRPPNLSGEDSILQAAFEASVSENENVVMKTPFSGEYRSSYVLFDIDNDNKEEAIVLYSVPSNGDLVNAKIFDYSDDEWINTSQISGSYSEIQEINFADINGDGCHEICLSWISALEGNENISSNLNLSYKLDIYSYENNQTSLVATENYTNLFIKDFNNNNADEILIFKINFSDITNLTTVRLLSFEKDYSISYDEVTNISPMPEICNIVNDKIVANGKEITRVFVDGTFNEMETYTEIIEIDNNFNISLPLANDNMTQIPKTLRIGKYYCMDVDGDGNIEIPTLDTLPYSQGIYEDKTGPLNLVVWSEYANDNFNVKFKALLNSKIGQLAIIPEDFIGNITAFYDDENLNLTFYSVTPDGEIENALFSFRTFTIPDWEENNYNYEMHSQNDTYVYSYLIFKADNYKVYKKFIMENFYALK
jgi:hypothetical protein